MEAEIAMRWIGVLCLSLGLAGLELASGALCARAQVVAPPDALTAELRLLSARAATVFVGQVTGIRREGAAVAVTFQVEQPVRGVEGSTYTLREWAGRWPPGHFRYQPGQRVLAFAYKASAAGFASPVHGAEGLLPVQVQGADQPKLVDVRLVAASVVRAPGVALPTEANGAVKLDAVLALIAPSGAGRRSSLGPLPLPIVSRGPGGSGASGTAARPVALGGRRPDASVVRLVLGTGHAAR